MNHKCLGELGQSAEQMFAYMAGFAFQPFLARLQTSLLHREMKLDPLLLPGPHHWFNALFLREQDRASILPRLNPPSRDEVKASLMNLVFRP